MTIALADVIAPELPFLRRFARALTGGQERGDAYVVALLETFVANERQFRRDLQPRSALYESFIKIWRAMPFNHTADRIETDALGNVEKRIETLTPLPRIAFLLFALEEFQIPEIAKILSIPESDASRLINEAGVEIAAQLTANVLIIEDEPLIALDIETLVTDIGHEVIGIARTRREATALAKKRRPGLVLADVQLADGSSGIDAVGDILEDISVPVIYITAYPERLLTGERTEPAFLIAKPFRPDMVKAVISQALFFDTKARAAA